MTLHPRPPLLALTIHRPWDWAIAQGFRAIENRDWPPPRFLLGRFIAVHAGKRWDRDGAEWMRTHAAALGLSRDLPPADELRVGRIVGVARIVGAVHIEGIRAERRAVQVVGELAPERVRQVIESPWAVGPWCWVLEQPFALPYPVDCPGRQKLWRVPDEGAELVRAAYRDATRGAA